MTKITPEWKGFLKMKVVNLLLPSLHFSFPYHICFPIWPAAQNHAAFPIVHSHRVEVAFILASSKLLMDEYMGESLGTLG